MDTYSWYSKLIKPSWAPPPSIFGPVWSVLYVGIIISFGTIFYKAATKQIPLIIALPFTLNIFFNLIFTPLQFGLKNNFLASIDILFILATLLWALYLAWNHAPDLHWIVYMNLPYLAWVSFATILQLTITTLNAK